jgi:hypothetical protein
MNLFVPRPLMEPRLDTYPRIRVAALRRAGVLSRRRRAYRIELSRADGWLSGEHALVEVFEDPDILYLTIAGEKTTTHRVAVVHKMAGQVPQILFKCPQTGWTVRYLLYVRGDLISRHALDLPYGTQIDSTPTRRRDRAEKIAHKLRGTPEKGPARGDNRARLRGQLALLRDQGFVTDPNDLALIADFPIIQTNETIKQYLWKGFRREDRHDRRMGTVSGLATGLRYYSRPIENPIPWDAPAQLGFDAVTPLSRLHPWPDRGLRRDVLENYISIDVRQLVAEGAVVPEQHNAFVLEWDDQDGPIYRVECIADLRTLGFEKLKLVSFAKRADDRWLCAKQMVALHRRVSGRRKRWVFLDPASPIDDIRLCEVIYFREGIWASAKAQRLTHRSQTRPYRNLGLRGFTHP